MPELTIGQAKQLAECAVILARIGLSLRSKRAPRAKGNPHGSHKPTSNQVRFGEAGRLASKAGLQPGTKAFGAFVRDHMRKRGGGASPLGRSFSPKS